jgi:hypothetical protein
LVRTSIAACLALATAVIAAGQQEKQIVAEGVAALSGNLANVRDAAIEDACRRAVEQAVGSTIGAESVARNYELIYDKILSRCTGYIGGYEVVDEWRKAELYHIKIKATVKTTDIDNDLISIDLLLNRKNRPRVMFVTDEEYIDLFSADEQQPAVLNKTETVLIQAFLGKGFRVVDSDTVRAGIERDAAIKAIEGDDKAAQLIGREFSAEVVIISKAVASNLGNIAGSMMTSGSANITARAVEVDTGRVLFVESSSRKAADPDRMTACQLALERAGADLGESLISGILAEWVADTSGDTPVQILVTGVPSYEVLVELKRNIGASIQGVREALLRSYSATTARLEIQYEGNPETLAEELSGFVFNGFEIVVRGTTGSKVDVCIKKHNQPERR